MGNELHNEEGSEDNPSQVIEAIIKKERLEAENTSREKERRIADALEETQITPEYAALLRKIHTSTTEGAKANLDKVNAALQLRKLLTDQEIAKKPIAYIGSGIDWEFPVALGARDITMVDPLYESPDGKAELLHRMQQFGLEPEDSGDTIHVPINLGNGNEDVTIRLVGKGIEEYHPDSSLRGVIEFAGPTHLTTRHIIHPSLGRFLPNGSLIANFDYHPNPNHQATYVEALTPHTATDFTVFTVVNTERFVQALKEDRTVLQGPSLLSLRKIIKQELEKQ